jgi:isoleucyl-tRNA synthetase
MAVIFEALCSWLAPVLCYTADEAWQYRPRGVFKDDADNIHLRAFAHVPANWLDLELAQKWEKIIDVRNMVLLKLEEARNQKVIGSALEAHIYLMVASDTEYSKNREWLSGVDMAEVCITSQYTLQDSTVEKKPDDALVNNNLAVAVFVRKAEGQKCERCWKVLPEVGSDKEFPTLTKRDADAVRWYVAQTSKAA